MALASAGEFCSDMHGLDWVLKIWEKASSAHQPMQLLSLSAGRKNRPKAVLQGRA
jgi:hypothetical protein